MFPLGLAILVLDASIVAWPMFATWPFALVTVGAFALAVAVSTVSHRRGLPWYLQVVIAVVAGILVGALLTHADRLGSLPDIASAYAGMLRGLIAGWKELLTVPLPAGSYLDVLVPWFVVVYVTVLVASGVSRAWPKLGWAVAAVGTMPLLFVLAFSSPSVGSVALFGLPVAATQVVVGLAWMFGAFVVAKGAASARIGTSRTRRSPISLGRRVVSLVSGAVVVTLAIGIVGVSVRAVGIPGTRVALRQDIEPALTLAEAPSPLSLYRQSFVDPELYAGTALTYSPPLTGGDGRIRTSVLPFYNGTVFSASPDGASAPGFARLPVALPVSGATETVSITIGDAASGLGPWLPVTDGLSSVSFDAPGAGAPGELYVNGSTTAAVVVARTGGQLDTTTPQLGVGPATTYEVVRGTEVVHPSLESLARPTTSGSLISPDLIPESMTEWMRLQNVPVNDGAGLAELVSRLRARGYLSHALTAPTQPDSWITPLSSADYAFAPSLAGHSVGRLDQLFTQLVDKQRSAPSGAADDRLVAAVGDDEQFAAAVALLAMANGFPARVVTGYVDCPDLTCTGAQASAWVEVQGADGAWASVDVDPQFENPIAPRSDVVQEPHIGTNASNDTATVLPPGDITPQAGATPPTPVNPPLSFDWVLPLLRTVGLIALALGAVAAPFVAIIAVKARRRRARRRDGNPRDRVVGAWEEYLDAALDLGVVVSPSLTRLEVADVIDPVHLRPLASGVDTAVFGTRLATDLDVDQFWSLVESAQLELERDVSWWRILMARLSLASFLRYRATSVLPRDNRGFVTLAQGETEQPSGIGGFTRYVTRSTRRRRGGE